MRHLITRIPVCLALSSLLVTFSAGQSLNRIVAVVDKDIILESDLSAQVQFYVFNNHIEKETPEIRAQVLQMMINEKLIIAQALLDSVTVSDDEVQQRLDAVIQQRIQQVGSESRLEELYGMPLTRIKREFRDEMRKNLLAEKLQQQRFGTTQISRREVEQFFAQYKDSIGQVPEEVELAHIAIRLKPGVAAREAAMVKARGLLDSLRAGADFADLARRHSEDPGSASLGGDLGLVRRGQFVKEFETAVFGLSDGQLSDIVETDFGLHIIELLERRGDAVHPRHILVRIERSEADHDSIKTVLNGIRNQALAGKDFAQLAREYSEYKETATIGGSLGTTELASVDKNIYPAVVDLKEGEISPPARLTVPGFDGYQIVLMKKRVPAHNPSLEQDYSRLESLALNYKRTKEYSAWLEDLRTRIYWESRL